MKYTQELKEFTGKIREILNSSEYGFHHKDRELLNCNVTGLTTCLHKSPDNPTLLVAEIHCRHSVYPKWKLQTYLKLIDLLEKINQMNLYHCTIDFTGNRDGRSHRWTISEMMRFDLE